MTTELDFGISAKVRDGRRCLFSHFEEAIDDLGWKVVIAASKARQQDIRDALNDRESRRFPIEWAWSIALVSPEKMGAAIARCLITPMGFGITPIRPLTTEEKLARLEERVTRRFGEAGAEIVDENRR